MPTVEPNLEPARGQRRAQRATGQPLQAGRPGGAGDPPGEGGGGDAAVPKGLESGDGDGAVGGLVGPFESGTGQGEIAVPVAENQRLRPHFRPEIPAPADQRGLKCFGPLIDHPGGDGMLGADHGGNAALQDAGLFAGDAGEARA